MGDEYADVKLNVLYKAYLKKGFTTTNRAYYKELLANKRFVRSTDILLETEAIPENPPDNRNPSYTSKLQALESTVSRTNGDTEPATSEYLLTFPGVPVEKYVMIELQPVPRSCMDIPRAKKSQVDTTYTPEDAKAMLEEYEVKGCNFQLVLDGENKLQHALTSGNYRLDLYFNPGAGTQTQKLDTTTTGWGFTQDGTTYQDYYETGKSGVRMAEQAYFYQLDTSTGTLSFLEFPTPHISATYPPIAVFYKYTGAVGLKNAANLGIGGSSASGQDIVTAMTLNVDDVVKRITRERVKRTLIVRDVVESVDRVLDETPSLPDERDTGGGGKEGYMRREDTEGLVDRRVVELENAREVDKSALRRALESRSRALEEMVDKNREATEGLVDRRVVELENAREVDKNALRRALESRSRALEDLVDRRVTELELARELDKNMLWEHTSREIERLKARRVIDAVDITSSVATFSEQQLDGFLLDLLTGSGITLPGAGASTNPVFKKWSDALETAVVVVEPGKQYSSVVEVSQTEYELPYAVFEHKGLDFFAYATNGVNEVRIMTMVVNTHGTENTFTYTYTDSEGNSGQVTRKFTAQDTTKPVFGGWSDSSGTDIFTVTKTDGAVDYYYSNIQINTESSDYTLPSAVFTDNGSATSVTKSADNGIVTIPINEIKTHRITYTFKDGQDQILVVTREFRVVDSTIPTFKEWSDKGDTDTNLQQTTDGNYTSSVEVGDTDYVLPTAIVEDNGKSHTVKATNTVGQEITSIQRQRVGVSSTFTYSYTDGTNSVSVSRTFTTRDTTAPVFLHWRDEGYEGASSDAQYKTTIMTPNPYFTGAPQTKVILLDAIFTDNSGGGNVRQPINYYYESESSTTRIAYDISYSDNRYISLPRDKDKVFAAVYTDGSGNETEVRRKYTAITETEKPIFMGFADMSNLRYERHSFGANTTVLSDVRAVRQSGINLVLPSAMFFDNDKNNRGVKFVVPKSLTDPGGNVIWADSTTIYGAKSGSYSAVYEYKSNGEYAGSALRVIREFSFK